MSSMQTKTRFMTWSKTRKKIGPWILSVRGSKSARQLQSANLSKRKLSWKCYDRHVTVKVWKMTLMINDQGKSKGNILLCTYGGWAWATQGKFDIFRFSNVNFPTHPWVSTISQSFPPLGTKNCISRRQKTYSVELLKKLTQEYQKVKLLYKALLVIVWWDFGTGLRIHLYVMPGIVCIFSAFIQLMFVTDVQNWPEFHLIWHLEYTRKSINIENIETYGRVASSEDMWVGSRLWSKWAFVRIFLLKAEGRISCRTYKTEHWWA